MAAAMNESSSLKPSKVSTAICTSKLPLKMMDQKARAYTAPSKISSTRRDRAVSAESDQRSAIVSCAPVTMSDRKSVGWGKSMHVRSDLGGLRNIITKNSLYASYIDNYLNKL